MALKILLADDSMTAQNMGKKILLDAGYEVVAVSNGAAAIKRISSDRPDIIILDVYMPGYTGLEVCERVKGAAETSRTPVLLTVGKMEPFKPEEANRVRADGVMIKPFEATDLIAAIQGIANKMSSGAQPRHENTIRVAPPVAAVDQTMRIAPQAHDFHDTVRVPPPRDAQPHPAYEETLRLTPEQVRAFQDKTYKDWVASAEVETADVSDEAKSVAVPEMSVTAPAASEDPETVPVEADEVPSILEPMVSSVIEDDQPAMPIMPGLDSTEAPIARAMAGKMGQDFFTVAPSTAPAADAPEAVETPAFFASSVENVPIESSAPSVFSVHTPEPELIEAPVFSRAASLELETSAPLSPGPSFVAPAAELEPTIVAAEEPVVAEVAPDLEINSPIHLQEHVDVATDAALITGDDDMSQFVTKFGQEGAEEVHVGVASDLPPEQLAALAMPAIDEDIKQEVPQLDAPEVVLPPMVAVEIPEPVVPQAVLISPEPEAPVMEAPLVEPPSNVLGEVGPIEPEAALTGTGPVVAYVPGLEDTQPIPAYVVPAVTEPEVDPVVAPEPEIVTSAVEIEPVVAPEPVVEPEPVVAFAEPEPILESEPVTAVAHDAEKSAEPEAASLTPVMESAVAAAVGGAVVAGAAHFFSVTEPSPAHDETPVVAAFAPALEEPVAEAPAEVAVEPVVSVAPEDSYREPIGDAALAEELAAALAEKEVEEQATTAADAAIADVEPAVTEALESSNSEHMIADAKLSDAVSRALEKLRPQLIAEIMKELFK